MAEPLDCNQLSTCISQEPLYAKKCIIQTALIQEVTDENGMYVCYSPSIGYGVYWHHQTSSSCIIFNECRDKIVCEAIKDGLISLCYHNIEKSCGLFYARDIVFFYNKAEYNWNAQGEIYRNDNPECKSEKQPDSINSFIEVLDFLANKH